MILGDGSRRSAGLLLGLLIAASPSWAEAAGHDASAARPPVAPHVAPVVLRSQAIAALGAESTAHILPVLRQNPEGAGELLRSYGPRVARVIRQAPLKDFAELKTEVLRQASRPSSTPRIRIAKT